MTLSPFNRYNIKCDICGKYISHKDYQDGKTVFYHEPLSEYGPEVNKHSHLDCLEKKDGTRSNS